MHLPQIRRSTYLHDSLGFAGLSTDSENDTIKLRFYLIPQWLIFSCVLDCKSIAEYISNRTSGEEQ